MQVWIRRFRDSSRELYCAIPSACMFFVEQTAVYADHSPGSVWLGSCSTTFIRSDAAQFSRYGHIEHLQTLR